MQADADYRACAEGLRNVYVRSRDGKPIPVTALAQVSMTTGPDLVERYNVFPAAPVLGAPAPGYSSGQALEAMEELASEHLPDGYTLAWRSEEHTSELKSLMRISYAVLCFTNKTKQ